MPEALVIIPTYNERQNVERLVVELLAKAPQVDLLFVDDASPDGTGEVLDRLARWDSRVHVLHRERKEGLGRAYLHAFRHALQQPYAYYLEMDADLSHRPSDVPRLIEAAHAADVVIGSRYVGGIRVMNWPLQRLLLSQAAAAFVRWVTGMPFTDPTSGFKCYRHAALEALELDRIRSNGYSFQIETVHRLWLKGFHIVEIPIVFEERQQGTSKMSGAIVQEALRIVWRLGMRSAFRRPPRSPHPASILAGAAARGRTA